MRTRITLECTECKQRNYNMTKDKKTQSGRMETKKYCKFCKSHNNAQRNKIVCGKEVNGNGMRKKEKAKKTSWFKGLKAEFKKDHLAG